MPRPLIGLLLSFLTLTFSACGQSGRKAPEGLIPVAGVVTLDGQPADHIAINFIPTRETSSMGGYAVTDSSGHFRVKHLSNVNGAEGLEPGNYQVTFSKIAMPDGSPIPEGKDAADVGAVESLPSHLSAPEPEKSRFILQVQNAQNDVNFDLKSKP